MPKKGDFNIVTAILALVLVLIISFSSYYLYKRFGVDGPLVKRLESLEGVEKANTIRLSEGYEIDLNMQKVGDLQQTYKSIDRTVKDSIPKQKYSLNLADRPNQSLDEFIRHMQPAIFESLAANRFIWLDQELARRTQDAGLQYKLFVDRQHLYLQVEDGDYFIYRVIDRVDSQSTGDLSGAQ